jgi:hypothetical protein
MSSDSTDTKYLVKAGRAETQGWKLNFPALSTMRLYSSVVGPSSPYRQ